MDISDLVNVYQQLDKSNLHLLDTIYHEDIVFEDSAHRVVGLEALACYFDRLYSNVTRCPGGPPELAASPWRTTVR